MSTSFRVSIVIAALLFLVGGLGGCPYAEGLLRDATPSPESGSSDPPAEDAGEGATTEQTVTLEDVATGVASGDHEVELAWSYGSTTISVNPNVDVGDDYVRTYGPPYTGGWSTGDDEDSDDDDSGDSDGSGDTDDSGDTDGPGDDPPDDPPGDTSGGTFHGTVQCAYRESLWDDEEFYGEITEDVTYQETIGFDEQGVPASIPVHPFICNDHTVRFWTTARFVGQTESFAFESGPLVYDVTLSVIAATYSPQAAHVELEIDFAWIGDNDCSIVATGFHTLDTQTADDSLVYSAYTGYEGVFTAADDWVGYGTADYDCSGTLPRQ